MSQRFARKDDIAEIQRICRQHREAFGFVQRPVLEDAIARQAAGESNHLLIVETDAADRAIGFLRLYHRRDHRTTLHEIGVERDHLGRGHGSALMRRAIRESRDAGQDLLSLSVPTDRPTNAWYPRFGFACTGQRPARVRTLNQYRLELRDPEDMLEELELRHDHYLHGRCHILAVALHNLTGWPIEATIDSCFETGWDVLMHAYVRDGDAVVDLAGRRTWEQMLESFDHLDPEPVPMTPEKLLPWGERHPASKKVAREIRQTETIARRVLDQLARETDARTPIARQPETAHAAP